MSICDCRLHDEPADLHDRFTSVRHPIMHSTVVPRRRATTSSAFVQIKMTNDGARRVVSRARVDVCHVPLDGESSPVICSNRITHGSVNVVNSCFDRSLVMLSDSTQTIYKLVDCMRYRRMTLRNLSTGCSPRAQSGCHT